MQHLPYKGVDVLDEGSKEQHLVEEGWQVEVEEQSAVQQEVRDVV